MTRGRDWWNARPRRADLALLVGVVILAVTAVYGVNRGKLSAGEAERLNEAIMAEYLAATAAGNTSAADSPLHVTRLQGGPLRVLFTGDSLSAGYFATTKEASFRSLMVSALGPVEETTAGRYGQTLTTVSSITDVPADLNLAVIELGTNDVGQDTPIDEFSATYSALLERIRAASPKAAILCAGTWVDEPGVYDPAIRESCTAAGGRFVSLDQIFDAEGTRGPEGVETFRGPSDDFHPNDAGHRAIADALLAAIVVEG